MARAKKVTPKKVKAPIRKVARAKKIPAATASEISKSWASFQPRIPFSYLVAARKAVREKNA